MKRTFDIGVSALGLLLIWPLLCVIASAILITDGRPVLFFQQRPGLHGQLFRIYKFRTMHRPGELGTAGETDADRVTRVGNLLRSTSLDELPELWNVLRGDMSLVGPRPLLPEYLKRYSDRQARRHELRPGITGLAQVSGRNAIGWDEKLELDVRYVESATLLLDAKILARTVLAVWRAAGVDQDGRVGSAPFVGTEPDDLPRGGTG